MQHAAFVCSSDVLRLLPVPVNRLRSPSSAFTARQPPWSPPEEAGQGRNMQNAEASRGSRWLEDISGKRLRRSLDQFRSYQSKTPALTSGLAVASQTLSSILFSTCSFCKQWYSSSLRGAQNRCTGAADYSFRSSSHVAAHLIPTNALRVSAYECRFC